MTVASTVSSMVFAGGQSVLTFTFPASPNRPSDIQVNLQALTGGTLTPLVYNTSYSVSINTSGVGGTVTILTSPTYGTNYQFIVYRNTSLLQASNYTDYNNFPSSTLMSNLDQLTMVAQELTSSIIRSLTLPIGTSTSVSTVLPVPTASTFLAWDPTGNFIQNTTLGSAGVLVQATVAQAQAGTNNSAFMTPSLTTITIKSFSTVYVSSVSSSTSDVTVVSTSTTPIITAVNAGTGGANTILRLNSSGGIPINLAASTYDFTGSSQTFSTVSMGLLKICYGTVVASSGTVSITTLPFAASTSYTVVANISTLTSSTAICAVFISSSTTCVFSPNVANATINWVAIGF